MRGKIGDKQRIEHILDACEKISVAVEGYDSYQFHEDFIISAAVTNFIMIIGEASSRITKEFKTEHQEFDWDLMKGMRNLIVHEYFGVDDFKIFETVTNDLPQLKSNCINVLKDFK